MLVFTSNPPNPKNRVSYCYWQRKDDNPCNWEAGTRDWLSFFAFLLKKIIIWEINWLSMDAENSCACNYFSSRYLKITFWLFCHNEIIIAYNVHEFHASTHRPTTVANDTSYKCQIKECLFDQCTRLYFSQGLTQAEIALFPSIKDNIQIHESWKNLLVYPKIKKKKSPVILR